MVEFRVHEFSILILDERTNLSSNANLGEDLATEFESFEHIKNSESKQSQTIRIVLVQSVNRPKIFVPIIKSRLLTRYWSWNGWFYKGRNSSFWADFTIDQHKNRLLKIEIVDEKEAYKFLYLFLVSQIGELLENRGFVRIHAFGVTLSEEMAMVVPLPSRGGKSTFCHWLLKNSQVSILGDEMVLVKDDYAYAFPLKMALRYPVDSAGIRNFGEPKHTLQIPSYRLQVTPIKFKLVRFRSEYSALHFYFSLLIGIGNIQMLEFVFRAENLLSLMRWFFQRAYFILRVWNNEIVQEVWSKNPEVNARNLDCISPSIR